MLILIVFLLFRLGRSGDALHWGYYGNCSLAEREENEMVLGVTTSTGYLFIVLILMLGVAMGDSGKIMVTTLFPLMVYSLFYSFFRQFILTF